MGLIFYLSHQPALPAALFKYDKLSHFIEYAILGLLLVRALNKSYPQNNFLRLKAMAFFITIVYAATDEFHQGFVPGRSLDFFDWLADSLGALASFFLFFRKTNRAWSNK